MSSPFLFKDGKGRDWDFRITVGTAIRLDEEGQNFHKLAEHNCAGYFNLQSDDRAFATLIWAIVRPQADKTVPLVDKFEFLDAITDGEAFFRAWEVFAAAYTNFTRDPQMRSVLKEAMVRQSQLRGRAAETLKKKAEEFSKVQEQFIKDQAANMTPEVMRSILDRQVKKVQMEAGLDLEAHQSPSTNTPPSLPSDSPGNSSESSASVPINSPP